MSLVETLRLLAKKHGSVHRPGSEKNVAIVATPRGGSTWLLELVCTQPRFRAISEPFSLRNPRVREHLGFESWDELYQIASADRIHHYLEDLASNRVTFMNLGFNKRAYRAFTTRCAFKLIHGAEDQIDWIARGLNSVVIILLRHPIAVSLSRQQLPRLMAFIESDYRRHFSERQLAFAKKVAQSGSHLERGLLSWCFQTSIPLRSQAKDVHVLTYEQLVLEPEILIPWLASTIHAPDPEGMWSQVQVPSSTVDLSFRDSREAVERQDRSQMVGKWKESVGDAVERRLMDILEVFELDAYQFGALVSDRFWLRAPEETRDSVDRIRSR